MSSFIDIGNDTYVNKKYIIKIVQGIKYINTREKIYYDITLTNGEIIQIDNGDRGYNKITMMCKGL